MVAYNTETYIWSWNARRASTANKTSALAWMEMLPPIESHCLLEAGLATLNIANSSPSNLQKRMIVLGNRIPFCWSGGFFPLPGGDGYPEDCLIEITAANNQRIPIDTIFIPEFPGWGEESFWVDLAAANRGKFTEVPQ